MNHIGHVIENSLGWECDIWSIPGRHLEDFGDRVREWAHATTPTNYVSSEAAYYGGWPSANLPTIGWNGVISTALLLENQVIGKDPISDWFCDERYNRPHPLAARLGWRPADSKSHTAIPDIPSTRRFLAVQLPAIRALLPLLDAGIVILAPSEIIQEENRRTIRDLAQGISDRLLEDAPSLAQRFQPQNLAWDDDVRGFFSLAGGAVEEQTTKYLKWAVEYFAAEYVLSQTTRATYTSVFDWESYLLKNGVSKALSPLTPTTQVMLSSRIPALTGLNPDIIQTIHDDEAFGDFRVELENIYGHCPLGSRSEVDAYMRDKEKTLLEPKLAQLSKDLERGWLSRLGVGAGRVRFSLIAGLISSGLGVAAAGPAGVLAGLLPVGGNLFDAAASDSQGTTKIWSSLVQHGQTHRDEIPRSEDTPGSTKPSESINPWGIEPKPDHRVQVTPGTILRWDAVRPEGPVEGGNYHKGVYSACTCGSTLKYKFCCAGITPAPE